MRRGIIISVGILAVSVLAILLHLTTPNAVGPFGVLTFFLCLYIIITVVLYIILTTVYKFVLRALKRPSTLRSSLENMPRTKLYYYVSVLALAPVIMLGTQSVGGFKMLDAGLVLLFEILACFYIYKRF